MASQSLLKIDPWIEVIRERLNINDNEIIDDYYSIRLPNYAIIVALTPDNKVIAEHHYKHGPRLVTLSLPGGYIELGENPLHTAQRELREETGYTSSQWLRLGNFVVDGNRGCGWAYLFLARDCVQVCHPISDDLEETQIELVSWEEMLRAVRANEIKELCSATALGLAYMEMQDYE